MPGSVSACVNGAGTRSVGAVLGMLLSSRIAAASSSVDESTAAVLFATELKATVADTLGPGGIGAGSACSAAAGPAAALAWYHARTRSSAAWSVRSGAGFGVAADRARATVFAWREAAICKGSEGCCVSRGLSGTVCACRREVPRSDLLLLNRPATFDRPAIDATLRLWPETRSGAAEDGVSFAWPTVRFAAVREIGTA